MPFSNSSMSIKHWEYNEALSLNNDEGIADMKAGLMRNSQTNIPTGIWFRWTYSIQGKKGVYIHCVAEDSYKVHNIPAFTLQDINLTLLKSFENFERIFKERLDLIEIQVPPPIYPIKDNLLAPLLAELKQ